MDTGRNRERDAVPLYVYVTTHQHSRTVCEAFAAGARAPLVSAFRLQPDGAVALYGRLRGCDKILERAQAENRDWYYIDRGYMRSTRDADYSGYFRVTKNALQSDGTGEPDHKRFAALGLSVRPWRKDGQHILVCPPGEVYGRLSGFDSDEWTRDTITTLKRFTDRPIRIREKPRAGQRNVSLSEDLANCWVVVVHSSNVAVDALLLGYPVIATHRCGASRCASNSLSDVESPFMPDDRADWAATLAAQQWTLTEMRDGTCWSRVHG